MYEYKLENNETGEAIKTELRKLKAENSQFVKPNRCLVKELADLKVDLG